MWQSFRTAMLLVSWLLPAASLSAQQAGDAAAVARVMDAWQKRRTAIAAIEYKVKGTDIYPQGSMTDPDPKSHRDLRKEFPPNDVSYPKEVEWIIDFAGGRLRYEQHYHILNSRIGKFRPRTRIDLFDGKTARVFEPRDQNSSSVYVPSDRQPDLKLYRGPKSQPALKYDSYPVFLAHGRPILYTLTTTAKKALGNNIDTSLFRYRGVGRILDRNCIIVRTIPEKGSQGIYDEFWVDLERDGAVLRWICYVRGSIFARWDIQYDRVGGYWLPSAWQFDKFSPDKGQNRYSAGHRLKVASVTLEPAFDAGTFSVPLKHRMVVYDQSAGATFMVGSNDETLVRYGQSTRITPWWVWGLVLATIGGVAWFAFRFRSGFSPR